jgi:hypothetical protein
MRDFRRIALQGFGAFKSLWDRYGSDVLLLAALGVVSVFSRWLTLDPIENGGDPLDNWYFVRQWAHETHFATWDLNHHTGRFGIHFITWPVQKIFGIHPNCYYLPPLIASNLVTLLAYVAGRQASGKAAGVIAALLVLECDPLARATSQLRPEIFECLYTMAGLVCLLGYVGAPVATRRRWLIACSVAMFLAYLAKIQDVFMLPGVALAMWLGHRRFKDVLLFAAILLGLFLVETSLYAVFTKFWGRLDVIFHSHLDGPGRPKDFWYLFERFTGARDSVKLVFYPFFFVGPIILAWRTSVKEKALVLMPASGLLFMTFLLRGFDPIRVFTINNDRYLYFAIPPVIVALSVVLADVGRKAGAWASSLAPKLRAAAGESLAPTLQWNTAALLIGVVGLKVWHEKGGREHPTEDMNRAYVLLNDAYARKLPIIAEVASRSRRTAKPRGLHWTFKGFIRDELLLAPDGSLPWFSYNRNTAAISERFRYIPAVPELRPSEAQELESRRCAVTLKVRGSFMRFYPSKGTLPRRCKNDGP